MGPKADPCGIPHLRGCFTEELPSTETYFIRSDRYSNHIRGSPVIPKNERAEYHNK